MCHSCYRFWDKGSKEANAQNRNWFWQTFLIICFEMSNKDMAIDFSYWQPCWYNNGSKGQKMVLFQNMYIFDSIFMGFFHWNSLCNSIQWYVNQFDITFSTVHKAFNSHFLLDRASILSTGSLQLTIEEFLEKPLHPPPEISVDITRGVLWPVSMFLTVLPNTSKWKIALGLHPKAVQYLTQDQFDLIRDQSSDRNEGENYRIHILVSVWCAKNLSEQKQGLISVPELLLETDSPYLSLSSDIQINNPRYLGNVTLIVAGLRGMQIAEVLAVSMANGWSLFS